MLIDADQAALEDRKEAFEGVGVSVATGPLILGVVHAFVAGNRRGDVVLRLVGNETAGLVDVLAHKRANHTVVKNHRADVAAALCEAKDKCVGLLAARTALGLL